MLHVLLILLKIIGIILALVLCLIVLILAVPIQYSFQMEKKEAEPFAGRIKVTWFFALLYLKVSYIESVFDYRVRIAGYQILGNQENFLKRKEEKEKRKQAKQKKKDEKQKEERPKQKETKKDELTVQSLPETVQNKEASEKVNQEKSSVDNSSKEKSIGKNSSEKKKSFLAKAKKTMQSVGKKFSSLENTVSSFKNMYAEYHGEELLRLAKKSIIRILKHILPRRLNGTLRFGFNDPATTGIVTGAAAIFYPKYQKHFHLEPDFQESCFEADCEGRGRIHLGFFLILVIQLILNPDVRKCIKLALR